jgi:hypothetical protein
MFLETLQLNIAAQWLKKQRKKAKEIIQINIKESIQGRMRIQGEETTR